MCVWNWIEMFSLTVRTSSYCGVVACGWWDPESHCHAVAAKKQPMNFKYGRRRSVEVHINMYVHMYDIRV